MPDTTLESTFTAPEIRLLRCLSPFRGAINFGDSLIAAYFQELRRFPTFRTLPFGEFTSLRQRMEDLGWWTRLPEYSDTEMVRLNPNWTLWQIAQWPTVPLGEQERIKKAFVRYYNWMGSNLYELYTHLQPDDRESNLAFMALEMPNLYQSLRLTLQIRHYDFNTIMLPINAWLDALSRHQEWFNLALRVKNSLETIPIVKRDGNAWHSLIHMYDTLGAACLRANRFAEAETWYRQALRAFHKSGQDQVLPQAYAGLYQNLAATLAYRQKWKISDFYYRKLHRVAKAFDDQNGLAAYYLNYGINLRHQHRHAESVPFFEEALRRYAVLEQNDSIGLVHLHLGTACLHLDRYNESLTHLSHATDIFTDLGDQFRLADVCDEYVKIFLKQRSYDKALATAAYGLQMHLTNGQHYNTAIAYQNMATASVGLQQYEEAGDYLRQAFLLFTNLQAQDQIKQLQTMLANLPEPFGKFLQQKMSGIKGMPNLR